MEDLKQRVDRLIKEGVVCRIFIDGHSVADEPVGFEEIDLMKIIKELTERESRLVEALRWYANHSNYVNHPGGSDCEDSLSSDDCGKIARVTLSSLGIANKGEV